MACLVSWRCWGIAQQCQLQVACAWSMGSLYLGRRRLSSPWEWFVFGFNQSATPCIENNFQMHGITFGIIELVCSKLNSWLRCFMTVFSSNLTKLEWGNSGCWHNLLNLWSVAKQFVVSFLSVQKLQFDLVIFSCIPKFLCKVSLKK